MPAANNFGREPSPSTERVARLSKLQRFMLDMACENRANDLAASDRQGGADLYTWEVLAAFYGFQVRPQKRSSRPSHGHIRRTSNNAAQIRCAEAAISRAARRLEQRVLIVRYGGTSNSAGIRVTSSLRR